MAVMGRHYQVNGCAYPGVSTILRATQSYEKIRALQRWRERVGEAEAQRISQEATSRGSLLHKITETHLKGEDVSAVLAAAGSAQAEIVTPFWEQVQTVLPALKDPFLVESVVWHPIGHYAGAIDLACHWEDDTGRYPVVLDWKTSLRPKRWEYLEDYLLQLTAYGAALNRSHDLKIQQGILIVSSPEALQVFPVDLKEHWGRWMQRLYQFWCQAEDHPLREEALQSLRSHYPSKTPI